MPTTPPSYLHRCLSDFRDVSGQLYKRGPFDLRAIEQKVQHLRGRRPLTYQDLAFFVSPEHWWFEQFWVFPPEEKVSPALRRRTFDFWHLPKNQDQVLEGLFDVFKSIELVSIILRFIKPEAYGIISPPVERVLDVRRGSDALETYRNYLDNLEAIRRHYDFRRAADVDMALWVLHERCFGTHRDPDIASAYATDRFMLKLRAHNLIEHLLKDRSYGEVAEAVQEIDERLAAVLASHTFELQLRTFGEILGISPAISGMKLSELIEAFPSRSIDPIRRGVWKRLKGFRDALFHNGAVPRADQIADLVREVRRLEADTAELRRRRAR